TFSKIYGLAALRIGWGYGAPALADALNRIRLPFNVPAPSQAAALAALADEAFLEESRIHAREGRAQLARFLAGLGFEVIAPSANFVTARIGDAQAIEQAFAARGILVRALANYAMPDALRITIGAPEEMAALREALTEIIAARR
ncbi:MAG TPA: aminotransferase class I/II-fold pyridoxal phosphate-dependent enzyme, partial [Terricaulis sp.]|nr:aminotransferase class I/II-fold pyridoxal phosphate-dependent enzyme [Terricaulis sp.]